MQNHMYFHIHRVGFCEFNIAITVLLWPVVSDVNRGLAPKAKDLDPKAKNLDPKAKDSGCQGHIFHLSFYIFFSCSCFVFLYSHTISCLNCILLVYE